MRTTKKSTYPSYPVDIASNVVIRDNNGTILFRSHVFNRQSKYESTKKYRKDSLTYGDALLSGLQPLRRLYYKVNESKVPATLRMGITNN